MAKIGELIVKIGADMTSLTKGIEESQKKLQSFADRTKDIGKTLTAAVTLPIVGAAAASFKMASDMSESINKVNVAFKTSASEVEKWAGTTLKSYGIAKGTSLDMAATFGDMATSMGLNAAQAAQMSMKLVGLAGDLASFKNISIDVANTALNGVFTGETESLKQLGIVMTQANLQEFAYAQGINKKIQEMSQAEQVQLRYNYILANTTNAQGDFARTSGGAANQMRMFNESLKEVAATMGANLLPLITPIITKFNDWLQAFGKLNPDTQKFILVVAGMAAALGPLLLAISAVTAALPYLSSAVMALGGPVGMAITILVGAAIAIWRNWDLVKQHGLNAWGQLKIGVMEAIGAIANAQAKLYGWIPGIGSLVKRANDSIQSIIKNAVAGEQSIIDARNIEASVKKHEDTARAAGKKLGEAMKSGIVSEVPSIPDVVAGSGIGNSAGTTAAQKVEKDMVEIGKFAAKGLALGMGEGESGVITQAQVLADAVKSIKKQIEDLNKQYEISYYATGGNSDATQQLREQIAELAKQYDNLTTSIGSASNAQQSLQQRLMGYAGSANSSNADYTAELIKQTITNSKIDWSKEKIGIEIGGRWAPKLPNFDGGGIVPGPIGRPQFAIVHGGEEVRTPQQQQKTGGDVKIDINIYDATDPHKVGKIVRSEVTQAFRELALGGAY